MSSPSNYPATALPILSMPRLLGPFGSSLTHGNCYGFGLCNVPCGVISWRFNLCLPLAYPLQKYRYPVRNFPIFLFLPPFYSFFIVQLQDHHCIQINRKNESSESNESNESAGCLSGRLQPPRRRWSRWGWGEESKEEEVRSRCPLKILNFLSFSQGQSRAFSKIFYLVLNFTILLFMYSKIYTFVHSIFCLFIAFKFKGFSS